MFGQQETHIFVIERDIYARQAIVSYLSWDRRTRVVGQASAPHEMLAELKNDLEMTRLDVIVLDTSVVAGPEGLSTLLQLLHHHAPEAKIICLTNTATPEMAVASELSGAKAYLCREQVGVGLASAVYFSLLRHFVVTQDVHFLLNNRSSASHFTYTILPERRNFPRLTERVEQALWLCVVEGLPAERAADEMGVSTSTVRSYIKEGYRILEAADDTIYPPTMSPAERAFLRYTALDLPELLIDSYQSQPAA